jgi:phosphate transport system permease protein
VNIFLLLTLLLGFSAVAFHVGRKRAYSLSRGRPRILHSLPVYHGYYLSLWCATPPLALFAGWLTFGSDIIEWLTIRALPDAVNLNDPAKLGLLLNDIRNLASGNVVSRAVNPVLQEAADRYAALHKLSLIALGAGMLFLATTGAAFGWQSLRCQLRARIKVERFVRYFLMACAATAVLTTVGIVLSLLFESLRFFQLVSVTEFLFGLEWSPQIALRANQVASSGSFGAVPLLAGTLLISFIAMCIAAPVGLLSAIYMAEYAPRRIRALGKPLLEILAGIPTVVYGFFAALTVAPLFRGLGSEGGFIISSESALAAGFVMGIMIIPFVSSLSDDVITAVPKSLRDGSLGLGATKSETICQVVIPAALPGIMGALLLAVSRAIGETMIVVMAAGLAANLTANPFEAVTTVTVQIVTLLVGDQEFDSAKTLAAFALGLVLFFITLIFNILALHIVDKYREQYD